MKNNWNLRRRAKRGLLLSMFAIATATSAAAQSRNSSETLLDPRGEAELTVCSQNLLNYAAPAGKNREPTEKELALIERFATVGCDAIVVQEIRGSNEVDAAASLQRLASILKRKTGRTFSVHVGSINDGTQRLGLILAKTRAEVLNVVSYRKVVLPKIDDAQKPRQFMRPPVEFQLMVNGRGDAPDRKVSIVAIHFKSKSAARTDPVGVEWETARMEMAEAVRRILEERYPVRPGVLETPVLVVGDRNSNFDTASAAILEGRLEISDFKGQAKCRLSKRGVPLCQAETSRPKRMISLLTTDPETKKLPGTYIFNKVYSWIDDILITPGSLHLAHAEDGVEGNYDSGALASYPDASDHAMVWARLNWP